MDASKFTKMFSDKHISDLKKMQHKYSVNVVDEMLELLIESFFQKLPIKDFNDNLMVYLANRSGTNFEAARLLMMPQAEFGYGTKAMEEEIHSTLSIENIDSSLDSIRRVLGGYAPQNGMENRIFGMKKGLDFISDYHNTITEENIYNLYMMTVGAFLNDDERLLPNHYYRHDMVYVVGEKIEHSGLSYDKLTAYMTKFVEYINDDNLKNDLIKAAIIHFYLAYLHPYFDGNGRMARLLHLWYLVQKGYPATLFVPFSSYIEKSRKEYYNAYSLIEENAKISHVIDVTPFLVYFTEKVYSQLSSYAPNKNTIGAYNKVLSSGRITEKEAKLWTYVLSTYGPDEFSTKQLEKDYGDAAYATIRGFVLKFTDLQLLSSQKYGSRVKYKVKT